MIMNVLLLACAVAQAAPEPAGPITGTVAETMDSGGYTYVRLTQGQGSVWVASPKTKAAVGQKMSFQPGAVMKDFQSPTLKRTFPSIVFSGGPAGAAPAGHGHGAMMGMGGGMGKSGAMPAGHGSASVPLEPGAKVPKSDAADGVAVAELYARRKELDGKTVSVRGKVVKVRAQIMGKNWVHLQDGSGDQKAGTHDLTVSTKDLPKAGEVVTLRGKARAEHTIGAGYSYPVLLEDAALAK